MSHEAQLQRRAEARGASSMTPVSHEAQEASLSDSPAMPLSIPPLPNPVAMRHAQTPSTSSFQQHDSSILIAGPNQLKHRLSRTRKPKSHPSSNTQCPITQVSYNPATEPLARRLPDGAQARLLQATTRTAQHECEPPEEVACTSGKRQPARRDMNANCACEWV